LMQRTFMLCFVLYWEFDGTDLRNKEVLV